MPPKNRISAHQVRSCLSVELPDGPSLSFIFLACKKPDGKSGVWLASSAETKFPSAEETGLGLVSSFADLLQFLGAFHPRYHARTRKSTENDTRPRKCGVGAQRTHPIVSCPRWATVQPVVSTLGRVPFCKDLAIYGSPLEGVPVR